MCRLPGLAAQRAMPTLLNKSKTRIYGTSELNTILHLNEYIKLSFLRKNLSLVGDGGLGVDGPSQGLN